jgi:hypothetical protein
MQSIITQIKRGLAERAFRIGYLAAAESSRMEICRRDLVQSKSFEDNALHPTAKPIRILGAYDGPAYAIQSFSNSMSNPATKRACIL